MKKRIKNITDIFFDLDRTLWDFEQNSKTALEILYREFELHQYFTSFFLFYEQYKIENNKVWELYYQKKVNKSGVRFLRFHNTLKTASKKLCDTLSNEYIEIAMTETALLPYAIEVLEYLQPKYKLHILSNGFKEVQQVKINNCKLAHFFETITTSEETGSHKPSPKAFLHAISKAQTSVAKSAMVGDDIITDISGAKETGLLSIYFNYKNNTQPHLADIEINSLNALKKLF